MIRLHSMPPSAALAPAAAALALAGAALVLAGAAPSTAEAHEFWLHPSSYLPARGDTIEVRARVGEGFKGEPSPYAGGRTRSLDLFAAGKSDLRGIASDQDGAYGRYVVSDGGGAVVAYESGFTAIELPAEQFDRYLESDGLDGPRAAREALGGKAGPGRERFARCAKTWIGGTDSTRGLNEAGLTFEIVPLAIPSIGDSLRVKVLFRGKSEQGVLVLAWHQPLAEGMAPRVQAARDSVEFSARARTDRDGVARLPALLPGEWLVSAVHMVPSADRAAADWESYWASLTFAPARHFTIAREPHAEPSAASMRKE